MCCKSAKPFAAPTCSLIPLLRWDPQHRDITARSQGKDLTAYETYRALPSPTRPYSGYDYAVVAEIIRAAEVTVDKAHKKGLGGFYM